MTLTSPAPIPLASRSAAAFRYLHERLRNSPPLKPVVRSWIAATLPIDFDRVPNARPAVFLAPTEGPSLLYGTGLDGKSTVRNDMQVAIGIAADGEDPSEALRLWDAIQRELWGNYRAHLEEMWDRGITAIRPVSPAHAPIKPAPESRFFVTTGVIAIQL
jgi:hypothetical protein